MILMLGVAMMALGALAGGGFVYYHRTQLSQAARDERLYLDAIAVLRDLTLTPDALTLRPDAQKIIDRHVAVTHTRKDTRP